MLQQWITQAKADKPLWLSDVREGCAQMPDVLPVTMQLTLCSGEKRDFPLPLPHWQTWEERQFVSEYVSACVFNLLSAFSGTCLTFYLDKTRADAVALLEELPARFQLQQHNRTGYGKAINVANRLCRVFGTAPFHFAIEDAGRYRPAPPVIHPKSDLAGLLHRTAARADSGLYCGVDIGGTDIKLALSRDGALMDVAVLDWNPAASPTPEGIIQPIVQLVRQSLDNKAPGLLLDGLGVSFPDVVIRNRIVGGETPKTQGMRAQPGYEQAFARLGKLTDFLSPLCRPGAPICITNDGHMAAFTAGMELACSGQDEAVSGGILAHSLGTDLGTGYLLADGSIPEIPLELYDFLLDLGSWPSRRLPTEDLRCVRNENAGLPGARRYLGQAAAFRLAWQLDPGMLEDYVVHRDDGILAIQMQPDLRKPCLEHLMQLAQDGNHQAQTVFRQIGTHLGQVSRELDYLLHPTVRTRFLFGRFIKKPACFQLLQEGCAEAAPELCLKAADETLAATPLMRSLAQQGGAAVAQYGQAVGAIYFNLMEGNAT